MDRLDKLRRTSRIQGASRHRQRRPAGSKTSERSDGSQTNNTTRASRAQSHTPSIPHTGVRRALPAKAKQTVTQQQNIPARFLLYKMDFTYMKASAEKTATPILTAIDVETGMSMAVLFTDKQQQFKYLTHCLHNFLLECGRTHAILANTVPQSDQEDVLMALLKATAVSLGSNISVRQASAYSSQSQGSVERFHRTLMGQVRTRKTRLQNNHRTHLTSQRPIMPWLVRHAAYLLTRYAVRSDGNTSYFRGRQREHKAPLCEFGETVQYMVPTVKGIPKLEPRFFEGIWPGKDTSTNDSIIGIPYKTVRARTIRRQVEPEKHNQQLLDCIGNQTMDSNNIASDGAAGHTTSTTTTRRSKRDNHRSANDARATAHYRNRDQTTVQYKQHQTQSRELSWVLQWQHLPHHSTRAQHFHSHLPNGRWPKKSRKEARRSNSRPRKHQRHWRDQAWNHRQHEHEYRA